MGINTAIIAPAGGNVGIGFAVPTNIGRAVVDQLLQHGEVRRGRIGIAVQTVAPDIATALGVPVQRGAVIGSVEKGSPAEQAGLKSGDVITAIDGRQVTDSNDVRNRVGLKERGSSIEVTFYRKDRMQIVKVKLADDKSTTVAGRSTASQLQGAQLAELPSGHPQKGSVDGVLVAAVEPGSAAWRIGIRGGDIIVAVNQQAVHAPADVERVAKSTSGGLAFNVLRGDTQVVIVVQG